MKKILLLLLTVFAFSSCLPDGKQFETSQLPLRQLVKTTDTISKTSGSYFLIAGSFNSETKSEQNIKMYVLVNDSYQYLEFPINQVRINISNNVDVPYLVIKYSNARKVSDERVTSRPYYYYDNITLYTKEEYLPEHLLPILIE